MGFKQPWAQMIRNNFNGKSVILYDRVMRHGKKPLDKSDTIWNIVIAPQARSMKGILILFVNPAADEGTDYARDSKRKQN